MCHGIPFQMPIVASSVHYSRFADCECRSLQIVVSNCTSVSSLGAPQHLHSDPMTSITRSDLLILDAQNELSLFLEELQDGLVVKLLLPTEPTTPTPFVDTFTSKEIWKTNNQFFLGATRQEDCPQETQPILQRFKNLLAYTAPSYYDDPINSPDTVAYTSDYSPTYPSTSAFFFPEGVSIPKKHYRYEAVALKPFGQFQQASSCNFNIYESQSGEKLQPISPICSREDVTSVQLLSVRMCINPLSPPLSGHEEMFDSEKTEYYPVTLVVDYAINLKGGQDYQILNDATQSMSTSVANDEDNCYIFGTATIKSASYSDTSTVLSPLSVTRPHLEETILASIVVLRSELGMVLRKCEVAINLDYEYILTELVKVIRDALHDIPTNEDT